jgi:hypothetical protein
MYTREELEGQPKYRIRPIAKQLGVAEEKRSANVSTEEMIDAILEAQGGGGDEAASEEKPAKRGGRGRAAGKGNGRAAAAETKPAGRGGRGRAAAKETAPAETKPTRRGRAAKEEPAKEEPPANGHNGKLDLDAFLSPMVERLEALADRIEAIGTVVEGNSDDGNLFEAVSETRNESVQLRYDSRCVLEMIMFLGEALEDQEMLEKGATEARLAEIEKEYGPQA